jgi:protein ImuA
LKTDCGITGLMQTSKQDIIAKLQKDLLLLQGLKQRKATGNHSLGLGPINEAFPHKEFPTGAVHEFISENPESFSATTGFVSGVLSGLTRQGGAVVWVGPGKSIFPPALNNFGIEPDQVIFIDANREKEAAWVIEESLKCGALSAVVGELSHTSFITSRRLQLAVEQSQVTGFILRNKPRDLQPNAFVSRWQVKPIPSKSIDDLPGIGFPNWHIDLLKIRNGKPGSWEVCWNGTAFVHTEAMSLPIDVERRKTG